MGNLITYALLAIGVNATPDAKPLRHAARDAVRFGLAVTSAKGAIPPRNAKYLLATTTKRDLDRALDELARNPPTFLMLYFGGHGNMFGIGLADDLYVYTRLRKKLAAIQSKGIVVILNCCEAGGMAKSATVLGRVFEDVDAHWGAALLTVRPGIRVFMASRSDESTYEDVNGGWFVNALLRAMFEVSPGDLRNHEYVSDQLVFERAYAIMMDQGVTPQAHGLFGDFPLVIANTIPSGSVTLPIRAAANLGIIVDASADDRRHLPTTVLATATDGLGNVLPSQFSRFLPMSDNHRHPVRFEVDLGISPGCQAQLWRFGACRVIWSVVALDVEGRVLGRRREVIDYHNETRFTWR